MLTLKARTGLFIAIACALLGLSLFLVPAWTIQPFRAQTPGPLAFALILRRVAPATTLVLAGISAAALLVSRPRRWVAAAGGLCFIVTSLAAVMVRVNYFEWMFHPNPAPQFVAVRDANVDEDDMVMVARVGTETRAYPVRIMAYHHLLNDTVGGVPVVPTY